MGHDLMPTRRDTAHDRPTHCVDTQRLRILRCTAKALAGSLGGFRFKAGTRPWLDELSRLGAASMAPARGGAARCQLAND